MPLTINTSYSFRVLQMGTVFAPTCQNLTVGYHEIKLSDLIELNYNLDLKQYFVENWKRFLDDCEILSKTEIL